MPIELVFMSTLRSREVNEVSSRLGMVIVSALSSVIEET